MTIPTGAGQGAFDYTSDTVAAQISVDVPLEAVRNLDTVVARTSELKTNLEAAARANHDVVDYLTQMPLLLDNIGAATSRYQGGGMVIGSGGRGDPNVPFSGRNDPTMTPGSTQVGRGGTTSASDVASDLADLEERDPRQAANMRAQRGGGRRNAGARPTAPSRPGSGRPRNRPDSPAPEHDPDPENNGSGAPDDYNFVDTRSNRLSGTRPEGTSGSTDVIGSAQGYATQGQDILNQVLAETRQGRDGMSNSSAALRGVRGVTGAASGVIERRALAQHIAEGGTAESFRGAAAGGGRMGAAAAGLGTAAKFAGVAGVAYTALAATQSVGEQYQQYKNAGMVRGGGAQEGMSYELQARSMAMNPFLNTEQSRKIINTALSEGYTGKEFETVTDFMADNLKNMNLQVADSVKLLDKNVNEGGQSIASLNTQLSTMKGLAGGGYSTLGDRQAIYSQVSGQAISNGVSGVVGGQAGLIAGEFMSDNRLLAGTGADLANSAQTSWATQQALRNEYDLQGVAPDQVFAAAVEAANGDTSAVLGTAAAGIEKQLKTVAPQLNELAKMPKNAPGRAQKQSTIVSRIQVILRKNGIDATSWGQQKVLEYARAALAGELSGGVADAQNEITAQDQEVRDTRNTGTGKFLMGENGSNNVSQLGTDIGGGIKTAWAAIDDTVGVVGNFLGFGDGDYSDTAEAGRDTARTHENEGARYKNDRIQELVGQYGSKKIKVDDGNGNMVDLDQNNKAQIEAIAKDKSRISIDGGEAMTLTDATASAKADGMGDTGGSTATVVLELTEEAKRIFKQPNSVRTETQMNADSGLSSSQYNKPTPSEQAPR